MTEKLEVARRLLEAFNYGDVEEACAVTDPKVEFVTIAEQVTGSLPNGHEGLREWFRATARVWEQLDASAGDWTVEKRGEWFVIGGHTRARARDTERAMEFDWTAVGLVEGERITRFGIFLARDEALAWIGERATSKAETAAGP